MVEEKKHHVSEEERHSRKKQEQKWLLEGMRKKTKKRQKFITVSIKIPASMHRDLKKKAKKIGCSMASLIKNYIHNGLEGVVVSGSYTQTQTVSQEYKFEAKTKKQPSTYQPPEYLKELKKALEVRRKRVETQR